MTQQPTPKQAPPDTSKIQFSWEYISQMKPEQYNALPREIQLKMAHWMFENSGKRK
jgi:hypothetical protein